MPTSISPSARTINVRFVVDGKYDNGEVPFITTAHQATMNITTNSKIQSVPIKVTAVDVSDTVLDGNTVNTNFTDPTGGLTNSYVAYSLTGFVNFDNVKDQTVLDHLALMGITSSNVSASGLKASMTRDEFKVVIDYLKNNHANGINPYIRTAVTVRQEALTATHSVYTGVDSTKDNDAEIKTPDISQLFSFKEMTTESKALRGIKLQGTVNEVNKVVFIIPESLETARLSAKGLKLQFSLKSGLDSSSNPIDVDD